MGIQGKVTEENLKEQYFKLAKLHHPDAAGGSQAFFLELKQAYDYLRINQGGDEEVQDSLDVETSVSITFEESIHGITKTVEYEKTEICKVCKGLGFKWKTLDPCINCGGDCFIISKTNCEISIPKGILDGAVLDIKFSGNQMI